MKQGLPLLFAFIFGLWAASALAQDSGQPAASVYNVADVAVDVTSDSAAKARDQAIAEAQRSAFTQLLERLGTDASVAAKLSNDDLSTLVQNFEVRNEKASSVRYIGVFAVQFRPIAVRNFLSSKNASFSDAQSKPVLILPVVKTGDKLTLWEEATPWQQMWIAASHDGGLVPLIVPTGSPEDKATISTVDVAVGKVDVIKDMIQKYKADAAVVVTLNGSPDNPAGGYTIDFQHFGAIYDDGSDVEHIVINATPDKAATDAALNDALRQIRHKIEKAAKEGPKQETVSGMATDAGSTPAPAPKQPQPDADAPEHMLVSVQFSTLPQWADIQRRLLASRGVRKVDITSVGRGETDIDLGYAGKPEDLQMALAQHGLRLTQDILSGQWMLKGF